MARFEIRPYAPEWDAQIRDLCKIPVSGNIELALEREPNYLDGAYIQTDEPDIYLCVENPSKRLVGLFNIGSREVYIQQTPTKVNYWCDLRIHKDYQGGTALLRMLAFVLKSGKLRTAWPAQTIVFGDNSKMLDLIGRSKSSNFQSRYPVYHFAGNYVSTLIGLGHQYDLCTNFLVRQARPDDLKMMQNFIDQQAPRKQYAPVVRLDQLHLPHSRGLTITDYWLAFKNAELVGICGTWDQRNLKQTVIAGYSKMFSVIRPIFNLLSPISGQPTLPAPGTKLAYLYIHTFMVCNDRIDISEALARQLAHHFREGDFEYLLFGCFDNDPLLQALATLKSRRTITGKYYLVSDQSTLPKGLMDRPHVLEISRI
jgi:hypothetical protein